MSSAELDLHEIRTRIAKALVDDFDATPQLAEEAVLKINEEHVDEFPDLDDLAEHVYDTQSFWES